MTKDPIKPDSILTIVVKDSLNPGIVERKPYKPDSIKVYLNALKDSLKAAKDKEIGDSEKLLEMNRDGGFYYRPATGVLFTSVPGYVEILFYDVSGMMRGSISTYAQSGETVIVPEKELLPGGLYFIKVKLDGKLKQKGMYKR